MLENIFKKLIKRYLIPFSGVQSLELRNVLDLNVILHFKVIKMNDFLNYISLLSELKPKE